MKLYSTVARMSCHAISHETTDSWGALVQHRRESTADRISTDCGRPARAASGLL